MIHATFLKNEEGQILSFSITGHAESGPEGQDIICAAVSALAFSTVNYLERVHLISSEDCFADEEYGGELHVDLNQHLTTEQMSRRQMLVEQLYYGLVDIAQEYGSYLTVKLK